MGGQRQVALDFLPVLPGPIQWALAILVTYSALGVSGLKVWIPIPRINVEACGKTKSHSDAKKLMRKSAKGKKTGTSKRSPKGRKTRVHSKESCLKISIKLTW
jgi:hypothetical protein